MIGIGARVISTDGKKHGSVVCREWLRLSEGKDVLTGYYVKWDGAPVTLVAKDELVEEKDA